jgi:hypothetical protein
VETFRHYHAKSGISIRVNAQKWYILWKFSTVPQSTIHKAAEFIGANVTDIQYLLSKSQDVPEPDLVGGGGSGQVRQAIGGDGLVVVAVGGADPNAAFGASTQALLTH